MMRRNAVLSALTAAVVVAGCGAGTDSAGFDPAKSSLGLTRGAQAQKTSMDMPAVSCGAGTTQTSIALSVCAGATGAVAGFSLQWMSAADLTANGGVWYDSSDSRLCEASFSGNANSSRYDLGPGECVSPDLLVGDLLLDNGTSTNCSAALACGTDYVFRAFAHANSTYGRSDFTANVTCDTLACSSGCTLSQGYWKNHGDWRVTDLQLGTVSYTDVQLLKIFDEPVKGNGLVNLAHQLIAAKINIANGAASTAVASDIAAADALIGGLVVPPIGSGYLAPSTTSALVTSLTNFNEGTTGPGHCE